MEKMETKKPDYEKSPVAWFVMLERAREQGNKKAEREALKKLHALGVRVVYSGKGASNA